MNLFVTSFFPWQVPLHLIESVEMKDLFLMDINCKDARSFRWVIKFFK